MLLKEIYSTNYVFSKGIKKRRFIYRNALNSTKILLNYINNYDIEKYNFIIK
ncbi:hypothetical protein JCM30566_13790 [Marinitoga arctica]